MVLHRLVTALRRIFTRRAFSLAFTISLAGCCAHGPAPTVASSSSPSPAPATPPVAAAPPAPVHVAAAPHAEPASAGGCRACGGDWSRHGIATVPSCLCPTGDGDRRCRDGAECQGECLADAGEHEVAIAGPPARGYFVGRCARYRTTFGCHRIIARGALKAGPVALDEPPPELCVD